MFVGGENLSMFWTIVLARHAELFAFKLLCCCAMISSLLVHRNQHIVLSVAAIRYDILTF